MTIQHILETTCIVCLKSPIKPYARAITKLDDEPAYATVECVECYGSRIEPTRAKEFQGSQVPLTNLRKLLDEHRPTTGGA